MNTDYYKILGVNSNAISNEIKKAYRKLALQYHPDRNLANTQEYQKIFAKINEAYSILSNEESRKRYDLIYKTRITQNEQSVSPHLFLDKIKNIRRFIGTKGRKKISETALNKALINLLSDNNLRFLRAKNHVEINKEIIMEVLKCCNFLTSQNIKVITDRLFILAGEHVESNNIIHHFSKNHKKLKYTNVVGFFVNVTYKITKLFN